MRLHPPSLIRREYLNGFRKRKQARRKEAVSQLQKLQRQQMLEERAEVSLPRLVLELQWQAPTLLAQQWGAVSWATRTAPEELIATDTAC